MSRSVKIRPTNSQSLNGAVSVSVSCLASIRDPDTKRMIYSCDLDGMPGLDRQRLKKNAWCANFALQFYNFVRHFGKANSKPVDEELQQCLFQAFEHNAGILHRLVSRLSERLKLDAALGLNHDKSICNLAASFTPADWDVFYQYFKSPTIVSALKYVLINAKHCLAMDTEKNDLTDVFERLENSLAAAKKTPFKQEALMEPQFDEIFSSHMKIMRSAIAEFVVVCLWGRRMHKSLRAVIESEPTIQLPPISKGVESFEHSDGRRPPLMTKREAEAFEEPKAKCYGWNRGWNPSRISMPWSPN